MAGGSGKRLWPLSRHGTCPSSCSASSVARVCCGSPTSGWTGVVAARAGAGCAPAPTTPHVVAAELPELDPGQHPRRARRPRLAERHRLDRPPCWPTRDPDAVMAVVASDHVMRPAADLPGGAARGLRGRRGRPARAGHLRRGADHAAHRLRLPAPGRGAARPARRACEVLAFKEKPDRPTAESYLDSGEYWWNSGMFVWRAAHRARPAASAAARHPSPGHRAGRPAASRLAEIYPRLAKISVDYARDGAGLPGPDRCARRRGPAADHLARRRRASRPCAASCPGTSTATRSPATSVRGRLPGQPGDQRVRRRPAAGRHRDARHRDGADRPDHRGLPRWGSPSGSRSWSPRSPTGWAPATPEADGGVLDV